MTNASLFGNPVEVVVELDKGDGTEAGLLGGAGPRPAGDAHEAVAPRGGVLHHETAAAVAL